MCFISIKPPTLAQPVCGWTALAGFPLAFKESWHLVNGRGEKTRMKNNLKVPPILIRSRNRQSSLALPRPSRPQSTSALTAASLTRPSPSLHWNSPRIVFDVILPTTQTSGVHFITAWNLGKKKKNNKKRRESCCLLNFSVPLTGFMLQQPLNNATVSIGQQTDATPESWEKRRHLPLFKRRLLHSEKWILFTRV